MDETVENPERFQLSQEITKEYRILRSLGTGGMGNVYLAEQLRVGRRLVALKVIKRSYSEDPEIVRRFENEAASIGRLDHENIIKIYDCRVTSDGQIYMAMEYVEGQTLRNLISLQGTLPLIVVVDIAKQVCAGLDASHQLGIVHRDIKPDNIMLKQKDGGFSVKVLDFGIARLVGTEISSTAAGMILGSASYMSPEQAEGLTGDKVDARADIYSLGMVVYEMLTGSSAFKYNSWSDIIYKQRYETPAPLRDFRRDIPLEVEQVVLKALSKDRGKRQQSIIEFANDLEAACRQTPNSNPAMQAQAGAPLVVPVESPVSAAPNVLSPNIAGAKIDDRRLRSNPSFLTRTWRSWKTLPKALKWVLIFILLPFLISVVAGLFVLWRGVNIIELLTGRPGHPQPASSPAPSAAPTVTDTRQPKAVIGILDYRAVLEEPTAELDTLAADNKIHSGQAIHFLVRLERPGSLYLLHERKDGFLEWVNQTAQTGSSSEWLQIPQNKDSVIAMGEVIEPEKFLMIFVPNGVSWSLKEEVGAQNIISTEGLPIIPQEAAAKLRSSVAQNGLEMISSSMRTNRTVTHKLIAPDMPNKLTFYKFELNHVS